MAEPDPFTPGAGRVPETDQVDRPAGEAPARPADRHAERRARDRSPQQRRPGPLSLDPDLPHPAHEPEIPLERLDPDAIKVISRLRHMGHQAYLVGGCVRDVLLGRRPKDFDTATDAHPGEVRAIFRNCRLIGRRFRLAHVYFRGGKVVEVATFRQNPVDAAEDLADEGDLLITRDNVFGTAEEDARRRDFTVNGLFYDPFAGEVIDYVGGRADLEARRIATIGDPEIRVREDPVRALRAVRFAARLDFAIDPELFAAMRRHAAELARCAPPRVLEETFKILRCGNANRAFALLRAGGALGVVLPALGRALDAGGEQERRAFHAHLAALDQVVRSGEEVSEAVLLGSLLMHLRRGTAGDAGADELLSALVQTARLPRRVAERTRLALGAQRHLHGPARRRRRGAGVAAQAYFRDALQLLEMAFRATGEGAEALQRWKAQAEQRLTRPEPADEVGAATGAAPAAEALAAPPGGPGRRRRRGGRRRRRRGPPGTAAASGTSGTPG